MERQLIQMNRIWLWTRNCLACQWNKHHVNTLHQWPHTSSYFSICHLKLMGASKETHCKVIYRWSRGCWDRERFIIFLLAVLTVPAGRGSLELLDSREMSVHKCCGKNEEKQRTGQRERGKSSRKKQFSHTKPFTRTWKEQIYPTHHPRGEQADTH